MKTKRFIRYVMLLMSLTILLFVECKNDEDAQPPPMAPGNLVAATVTATGVDLQWQDNANNEAGFRLERKDADSLDFKLIKDLSAQSTEYSDTGLNQGTTYQYRVLAYNAAGESGYSNTLKITTLSVAPKKPLELKLKVVSSNQIDLSWTDESDNETGFKVERAIWFDGFEEVTDLPENTTVYQDKDLSPNTLYHYRILAYNGVGNSEYSNVASDTTKTEALKAPTNLAAESTSTDQIDLTWEDNNSHETGFILERATNKSAVFVKIADLEADSTTYKDSELSPDTYYRYRVKAYNISQESDYSDTLTVKTDHAPPTAPTNLVATPSILQIQLEWEDNSNNELGFIIERFTGKAIAFKRIDTVNSDNTSYLDSNLTMGIQYTYRIKAYNSEGNSDQSNIVRATTFTFQSATESASFSARSAHATVVFDNKLWVIGGTDGVRKNDVWYSADGVSWTEATSSASFSARTRHTTTVFNDKLWLIGGVVGGSIANDVWHSMDGMNWTEATSSAPFPARNGHTTVVFDNKLWLIGGQGEAFINKNDVWYSENGIAWTEATSSAAFSGRFGHTTVVFDDKIWVIGGQDNTLNNDVWHSSDGVTWTKATSSASFSRRRSHAAAVYANKIWLIGGAVIGSNTNDVWHSADGVTWREAISSAPFSARSAHTTAVFDGKLWVIGGTGNTLKNDVWFLP